MKDANMKDKIFWPDRSAAEVAKLQRKGERFFQSVIRRKK